MFPIKYRLISALSGRGQGRECLVSKVRASQPKARGGRTVLLAWPPPAKSGKGAGILHRADGHVSQQVTSQRASPTKLPTGHRTH